MADGTKIEWTDATWNPITGCSIKSPGCINCYAQTLAGTRLRNIPSRKGLTDETKNGPVFNGKLSFNEGWLDQPLRWKRPRRIFVCAHGDLFHENAPDEWIDKVFAVMALSPQHQFQVLTKRADRMRKYFCGPYPGGNGVASRIAEQSYNFAPLRTDLPLPPVIIDAPVGPMQSNGEPEFGFRRFIKTWPLPNVWLGVSTERQQEADERIPDLLKTPAAKRFISAEPLIGPIDLASLRDIPGELRNCLDGTWRRDDELRARVYERGHPHLDWVIVGGESGRNARPMHPAWASALRDQCKAAGVPFFFKQQGTWGEPIANDEHRHLVNLDGSHGLWESDFAGKSGCVVMSNVGKKAAGRLLDGFEHSEFPA